MEPLSARPRSAEPPPVSEAVARARVVAAWKELIALAGQHCLLGRQAAETESEAERNMTIELALEPKRTATLVVRAGSLRLFTRWCATVGKEPFPLSER
eukprot:12058311-Alexandrium_andersonii.AAC.1